MCSVTLCNRMTQTTKQVRVHLPEDNNKIVKKRMAEKDLSNKSDAINDIIEEVGGKKCK